MAVYKIMDVVVVVAAVKQVSFNTLTVLNFSPLTAYALKIYCHDTFLWHLSVWVESTSWDDDDDVASELIIVTTDGGQFCMGNEFIKNIPASSLYFLSTF